MIRKRKQTANSEYEDGIKESSPAEQYMQSEIAGYFQVTTQRIEQLEKRALRALRWPPDKRGRRWE